MGFHKYSAPPVPINYPYHSSVADAVLARFAERGAQFAAMNSAGIRGATANPNRKP